MIDRKSFLAYCDKGEGISLHNHTRLSDGATDAETMCRAAKAAGLRVFGLSDHYVVHPKSELNPVSWCIGTFPVTDYCAEMARLKKELNDADFTILTGLEVDFFAENVSEVLAELEKYPLDYLIGSVHYSGTFPIDHDISDWEVLSEAEADGICRTYWEKLRLAAACGRFTFLGHLDLPKKFGQLPDPAAYWPAAERVLDAAAASGTPIELNTAGWYKPCAEQYPALELLKSAKRRTIPVVISADAHCPKDVARGFPEAKEALRKAGWVF